MSGVNCVVCPLAYDEKLKNFHVDLESKVARERPSLAGEGYYWSQKRSNPPRVGNLLIPSREMAFRAALNCAVIKSQTDFTETELTAEGGNRNRAL